MKEGKNIIVKGIAASPGIAIGKAFLFFHELAEVKESQLSSEEIPEEIERFRKALEEAKKDLLGLQEEVVNRIDAEHARIFEAQVLILEDEDLNKSVIERIEKEKRNSESIYKETIGKTIRAIASSKDEYIRERSWDINEVCHRVINKLLGIKHQSLEGVEAEIVVAKSLSPGEFVGIKKESILGFATDFGGKTSHVSLLAKSLGIPAVVGLKDCFSKVKENSTIILDGYRGEIIISPDEEKIKIYDDKRIKVFERNKKLAELKDLPAETLDKKKIELAANIELPGDVSSARQYGAQGVGLFRTEYLYLTSPDLPTEEEQYQAYKTVVEKMNPHPVILRTFDLGGDKFSKEVIDHNEPNPFLGWRAIRVCLDNPETFKVQLRAMLKASAFGNLKIMFPMISSVEEILRAKKILNEVKDEFKEKKIQFKEDIEIGIMIEIPSAALAADSLAQEVNFFSIGTNDLIQYTLAVDRSNEKVAPLYQFYHPAVLRLIRETIEAGHRNNIWVGLCGELAGEPLATAFLVGLGIDELSTSPIAIPPIKRIIRSISFKESQKLAQEVMSLGSALEIEERLKNYYQKKFEPNNASKL
jgi:phosphotransferase system enzyme I (PtsI)